MSVYIGLILLASASLWLMWERDRLNDRISKLELEMDALRGDTKSHDPGKDEQTSALPESLPAHPPRE